MFAGLYTDIVVVFILFHLPTKSPLPWLHGMKRLFKHEDMSNFQQPAVVGGGSDT